MDLLRNAVKVEPPVVEPAVEFLVASLNTGQITPGDILPCLGLLADFAGESEQLRVMMDESIDYGLLDHYCNQEMGNSIRLSEALRIGRPQHYYDLARSIRISGGSIVVIGAGFSYDSYAPLLREMEGIACVTLDDLGVSHPHELYQSNSTDAWSKLGANWQLFQSHVYHMFYPKQPSEQHFILAELFHDELITHIVSLNWDDLVEKAYRGRYGEDIPKVTHDGIAHVHALWKVHGDVLDPSERWIYPHEEGRIFDALHSSVSNTAVPGIVIGYREQEPAVCNRLISILESRGGVTRIRPDLESSPPGNLSDSASIAMKRLKAGLDSARQSA